MKTLEEIRSRGSQTIDGRDFNRLAQFLQESEFESFGLEIADEFRGKHIPIPYTVENVIAQMKKDVAFGFQKVMEDRSLSASTMATVVALWIWVLEDDLAAYSGSVDGFLSAVALKFGFDNPMHADA
jgi:hypothetical protein